ncbi:MAG: hypothetical protein WCI05_17575 [Myxococcales bacterium]|jgi:hypothetical protein
MLEAGTDELQDALRAAPAEKAKQTFAMSRTGFALKRAQLRARNPGASEAAIERLLQAWLEEDER